MKKIKNLMRRYPVITSAIIFVAAVMLTEIDLTRLFTDYLEIQSAAYLTGFLEQSAVAAIIAVLIIKLDLQRYAGFSKPGKWKQLWLAWPILVLSILNASSFFEEKLMMDFLNPLRIVLFVLLYLSVGFYEEIVCRGFVASLMLQKWGSTRKGIYRAVITSGLLFGFVHILNFIMGRASLVSAGTQIIYAFFFGVFFAALILRNNSIWPAAILHAIFDICGNLSKLSTQNDYGVVRETSLADAGVTILVTLPLLLYGLFILRKVEPFRQNEGA